MLPQLHYCGTVTKILSFTQDVVADIEGAMKCGMSGLLVKTGSHLSSAHAQTLFTAFIFLLSKGKYRDGDEGRISPPPTAVCDSFHDAVDLLLASQIN